MSASRCMPSASSAQPSAIPESGGRGRRVLVRCSAWRGSGGPRRGRIGRSVRGTRTAFQPALLLAHRAQHLVRVGVRARVPRARAKDAAARQARPVCKRTTPSGSATRQAGGEKAAVARRPGAGEVVLMLASETEVVEASALACACGSARLHGTAPSRSPFCIKALPRLGAEVRRIRRNQAGTPPCIAAWPCRRGRGRARARAARAGPAPRARNAATRLTRSPTRKKRHGAAGASAGLSRAPGGGGPPRPAGFPVSGGQSR